MGGRMCRICIPRRREEPLRRISAWIRKKEKPVSAWSSRKRKTKNENPPRQGTGEVRDYTRGARQFLPV